MEFHLTKLTNFKSELKQKNVIKDLLPKNGREMCEADYVIDGYTINQVNLGNLS